LSLYVQYLETGIRSSVTYISNKTISKNKTTFAEHTINCCTDSIMSRENYVYLQENP